MRKSGRMYNIEFDKVYEFTISASFGDLSQDVVNELLRKGPPNSPFMEKQLAVWFPEIEHIPAQKGWDHKWKYHGPTHEEEKLKKLLDAKSFTKSGLGFAPSHMVGAGRKLIKEEAKEHAHLIDYILCDIVEFPYVRIRFIRGVDLYTLYPSFSVSNAKKNREALFGI